MLFGNLLQPEYMPKKKPKSIHPIDTSKVRSNLIEPKPKPDLDRERIDVLCLEASIKDIPAVMDIYNKSKNNDYDMFRELENLKLAATKLANIHGQYWVDYLLNQAYLEYHATKLKELFKDCNPKPVTTISTTL